MWTTPLALVGVIAVCGQALAVDVPLTVRENAGVARLDNPVNSGVPLPKGKVREASELRLLDADGEVVLASIEPRARWLGDKSLKWVTVHFVVPELGENGELDYRLVTSDKPLPESPLSVMEEDRTIVVVTGPTRFVVPTDRLGPFEQVSVRSDPANDFADGDAILAKPASVTLIGRNGHSRVVPRPDRPGEFKSELERIDETPFMQTPVVQSADIEERGPGRAVIALKGTFSTDQAESLDFTARLYFYAGSSLTQMTFSVINRQLDSFAGFVGIERLAVEMPVEVTGASQVAFSRDGEYSEHGSFPAKLTQTARDTMTLATHDGTVIEGRKSEGWVQLTSSRGNMTAGTRWFWQTYPMGLAIGPEGEVSLELASPAPDRIELYTGGAKTHFAFFHFAKTPVGDPASRGSVAKTSPRSIAAGTMFPLVAACSPDWYCQDTRAFGDLFSANLELYEPKYRDLVARFQKNIDDRIRAIVEKRPRPGWKVDEYGWLDFGSGLASARYVRETAAESWWDGNYYDFPYAAIINYLRTGELLNLTTAEEAGLHLADLDICHSYPGQPSWAGSPRSGPVVGHFRNYAGGQNYQGHGSFTFYKNESLYALYYLTGERWYHDVALMSSDFAMARWGQGALRNLAHGIWGVLSAYHDTHQKEYLDRARFFVDEWGKPWQDKGDGSFNDQQWMYGLLFEAYDKYYRVTGDKDTAAYLVKALDALIAEFWRPQVGTGGLHGINLFGYGLGYEYTGNEEYFRKGLVLLNRVSQPDAEGDRVKTFAQNFRSSPYFLKYLTAGYQPEPILPASVD